MHVFFLLMYLFSNAKDPVLSQMPDPGMIFFCAHLADHVPFFYGPPLSVKGGPSPLGEPWHEQTGRNVSIW